MGAFKKGKKPEMGCAFSIDISSIDKYLQGQRVLSRDQYIDSLNEVIERNELSPHLDDGHDKFFRHDRGYDPPEGQSFPPMELLVRRKKMKKELH